MLKKLFLVSLLIFILLGSMYFFSTTIKSLPTSSPARTSVLGKQLSELKSTWTFYSSPEWGFTIHYPLDVKMERTKDGLHLFKIGPAQTPNTAFFDGLSLWISSAKLPESTFEDFVKTEYSKAKKNPANKSISNLQTAKLSTFTGYQYTTAGFENTTTYYLKNGTEGYIKIIDMTIEPPNTTRNFHKTIALMLSSFQEATPTTDTSPENN